MTGLAACWQKHSRLDRGGAVVLVAAALLCFTRYRCPLQEPQEARYAEIPRQMLDAGQWLVPVLHQQPYYDKPPLLYWLVMLSYRAWGVHDWAARLVPCSAAFLCVLALYAWGKSVAGPRSALSGALMLALAPRFLQLERMLTPDSLLCLWVLLGWAAGHRALAQGRFSSGWWLSSALASGLGLLTKGPVALVLVLPPLVLLPYLENGALRPSARQLAAHVGAALLLAGPWFVALAVQDPEFLRYFFWLHHVQRFVEPFDHEEPFWYYLPVLLGTLLPWSLLLPGMVRFLLRNPAQPAGVRFCVALAGWCLVFFSLSGCKRPFYLLPAVPPLALALGCYLERAFGTENGPLAYWKTALVAAAAAAGSFAGVGKGWIEPLTGLVGGCLAITCLAVWLAVGRAWRCRARWASCLLAAFVAVLLATHQVLPGYARQFSLRGLVRRHADDLADAGTPVISYPRRWDSISFYLKRNDVRVYTPDRLSSLLAELEQMPEALLFIKPVRGDREKDLLGNLPAGLVFESCGRQGALTVGRVKRR